MHTQPQLKKVPKTRPFLHIRKIALFNGDQLNCTSFYLGFHNRLSNKLPFFFAVNYRQRRPCSPWRKALMGRRRPPRPQTQTLVVVASTGTALVADPSSSQPPNLARAGPYPPQTMAEPRSPHAFLTHTCGAISAWPWPPFPSLPDSPHYFKNCTRTPRGHRCNQETQLNNPSSLLLPQMAFFFSSPEYFLFQVPFQNEKRNKKKKEEQQGKKKRKRKGGGEKKETVLLSFPYVQGN